MSYQVGNIAADPVERLQRLQAVAAALVETLTPRDTARVIVAEAIAAVGADSAGVWQLVEGGATAELLHQVGLAAANLEPYRRFALAGMRPSPIVDALRSRWAVWVESRAELDRRYPEMVAAMAQAPPAGSATASIPLVVEGRCVGGLLLSFQRDLTFSDDDRGFLLALARYCAQAMERSRLFAAELEARNQAEASRRRANFLLEASALLAESLDYQTTLANVVRLAVPRIADWCSVELVDDGAFGAMPLAVAHIDPSKVEMALEMRRRYPPDPSSPRGLAEVLRTGKSDLYEHIPDEVIAQIAHDEAHLRLIRELGFNSAMIVPLTVHGRTFGAITFIAAESGRRYDREDLAMAEDLARRSALAIENARLYREAREAIRVRDDFVSIAGHELRTPLSTLKLQMAAIARERERAGASDPTRGGAAAGRERTDASASDPPPGAAAGRERTGTNASDPPAGAAAGDDRMNVRLARMGRSLERLERLVDQLLDVSRITAGRMTLEREPVDLTAVVREATERAADDLARSRCPLDLDLADSVVGTWDASRVEQVVENLLGNAIKYGGGKPVQIRLAAADGVARLTIRDQGLGISAEDQGRIFDRFERVVTDRDVGGLGLGLWIVRQIIEAHGGSVHVDSALDAGSTFTVELPLSDE